MLRSGGRDPRGPRFLTLQRGRRNKQEQPQGPGVRRWGVQKPSGQGSGKASLGETFLQSLQGAEWLTKSALQALAQPS